MALKISARPTLVAQRLFILGLASLCFACTTNTITVKGTFPPPLVEKIPITLGVYYDDVFANHVYEYQPKGLKEIKLVMNTGQVQRDMFNTLLPAMFERVIYVNDYPPYGDTAIDLVLVPEVDDFQHAIPHHTKINVFEIWLRYRMKLFDTDGEPVADWIMTSYGKTPTAFLQSNDAGINSATVVALRDAGANFALNFARVPEVQLWLEEHLEADMAGDTP